MTSEARDLLSGHAADVAAMLLNGRITSLAGGWRVALRITEVEAYGGQGEDPGSHAFARQTPRNATMFGPPGRAYVYFTYGMHWCLNVVTRDEGLAGAVLIRAGEVVEGIATVRDRRPGSRDRDLARGPARLTRALGVTGDLDGVDLLARRSALRLALPSVPPVDWQTSPRTGVGGSGAATPWRFFLPQEATVSPYRRAGP